MARPRFVIAALLMAAGLSACASPLASQQIDQAATAVAGTLSALSGASPAAPPLASPSPIASPAPTQPPAPTPVPGALPQPLYYLNKDADGRMQVFRLAQDGRTVQQITFEPADVDDLDLSPVDGSLAYVSNNQLLLVDGNGAGRRILLDGGGRDANSPFVNQVSSPAWSPDGRTLAFGYNGLNFYSLDSGNIQKALEDRLDDSAGFAIPRELYTPGPYAPDGSRLLVRIGFYEGETFGVYRPADNSLVRFTRSDGAMICCELRWTPDGGGLYAASASIGTVDSGLLYLDAASGEARILLPGSAPDGTFNFAAGPQVGRDGKLYFFFNNLPQIPVTSHTPLYLVRSDTDGATGRARLKQEAFDSINEVLWAPDAGLAVVVGGPGDAVAAGGAARVVYPDERPDLALLDFAEDVHWGK